MFEKPFGLVLRPPAAALALGCVLVVGCEEKKPNLAPVATTLPSSPPPPASPGLRKLAIDPASRTSIFLPAPKEKIRATTSAAAGQLDVDLTQIERSRGEVKIDLTTLTTSTFTDAADNAKQTANARTWLEVADGPEGKIDEKTKELNRYAVYAIRAIEKASASDVTKVAPVREGADDVRSITLTARGELLLHGRKVEREADLEARFSYDSGAAADQPRSVHVVTKKPLRVVLAEHDVKPRDKTGKIAKEAFNLLGTKVADEAEIALDLTAKPGS
mgnify:CR=1 FL=1